MPLPNHENAIVPESKITDYLLSPSHPDGRGKAVFFMRFGFSAHTWQQLAEALLRHASEHELTKVELTPFGTRYIIEGTLQTPIGQQPRIRAVWFIESESDVPRLVTAYPVDVRETDDSDSRA